MMVLLVFYEVRMCETCNFNEYRPLLNALYL